MKWTSGNESEINMHKMRLWTEGIQKLKETQPQLENQFTIFEIIIDNNEISLTRPARTLQALKLAFIINNYNIRLKK